MAHAIRASQTDLKIKFHAVDPHTSLTRQKGFKVDDFYAARSRTIPPLPWSNIAPPFSIERVPPRLDLDVYPFLPRTTVEKTFARAYLSLLSDRQEAA